LYRDSPLLWVSEMQTQVAFLSTMEAKYVPLLQSMRGLIPIRQLPQEIITTVVCATPTIQQHHSHIKAFEDMSNAGPLSSTIARCTVYEDNHACLKLPGWHNSVPTPNALAFHITGCVLKLTAWIFILLLSSSTNNLAISSQRDLALFHLLLLENYSWAGDSLG
jgi:hypothetical protein